MIFDNPAELKSRIEEVAKRRVYGRPTVVEDTTSFMTISGGHVLRLGGNDYYVLGETREGRFGIDDQPKFWVKYGVDLTTGARKILKLVFHEQFTTRIGPVKIRCTRSPEKEVRILEMGAGHPRLMQGITIRDNANNPVRIIDLIPGRSLLNYDLRGGRPHEEYYHEVLPGLLPHLVELLETIALLHHHDHHHGDIRNDHIIVDSRSGLWTWIDFDYSVNYSDYDTWSLGNILSFVIGGGIHTFHEAARHPERYPALREPLDSQDSLLLFRHRIANLRKLFPWIAPECSDMLMRFSGEVVAFYESVDDVVQVVRDLCPR